MNAENYDSEAVAFVKKRKIYLSLKRVLDLIVSVLACAALTVPMALIAIIVVLDSPGGAIFSQKRMGKDGKIFTIYKFRTMKVNAPDNVASREMKMPNPYVTRAGVFLRRTSLDELPQLWNVILGDMSIVGYRPLCLSEENINSMRKSAGVFLLRPGITGLAQVNGRDDIDAEEKVYYDAKYVKECSLKMDIHCAFKTVATVVTGKGVK